MVKEIYSDSRRKALVVILVIVDLFLVLCSIPLFLADIFFLGLSLVIATIIFTVVFAVLIIWFSHLKKKNNEIVEKGYMVNGKIISIGYERHRNGHGRKQDRYWLDIQYTDKDGLEHVIQSPHLGFKPQQRNDITCDLYIYNDQVFATNFVNLYRDKTDELAPIIGLIVGLAIVGIMFIASQIL